MRRPLSLGEGCGAREADGKKAVHKEAEQAQQIATQVQRVPQAEGLWVACNEWKRRQVLCSAALEVFHDVEDRMDPCHAVCGNERDANVCDAAADARAGGRVDHLDHHRVDVELLGWRHGVHGLEGEVPERRHFLSQDKDAFVGNAATRVCGSRLARREVLLCAPAQSVRDSGHVELDGVHEHLVPSVAIIARWSRARHAAADASRRSEAFS
eukprot:scaffold1850_cov194-Pinguiococcus_pyrenoidosus.AAC.20